ncbi:delta-60 repeat domain-containing protein [Dokdonella sp.]|uniref:delta-60 repeat domain-containing protein n=1 Tax=Dokdonella sp. TaxID=2291710 RepID=UPI003C6FDB9E
MIVAGQFTNIAGPARVRIARLLANGEIDAGFAATTVDNTVFAVEVQADGRILIDGALSEIGACKHNRVARLNADGSFAPIVAGGASARRHADTSAHIRSKRFRGFQRIEQSDPDHASGISKRQRRQLLRGVPVSPLEYRRYAPAFGRVALGSHTSIRCERNRS